MLKSLEIVSQIATDFKAFYLLTILNPVGELNDFDIFGA